MNKYETTYKKNHTGSLARLLLLTTPVLDDRTDIVPLRYSKIVQAVKVSEQKKAMGRKSCQKSLS